MNLFNHAPSKHHKENAKTKPNGKFIDEDFQEEEDALLEKIKHLEDKLKYANEIIEAQKIELKLLREASNNHTEFLHSTICELIQAKNKMPPISPSVAKYLAKKEDATVGPKEGAKLP